MANILETMVLLFFGISWPMTLAKNWRVRSAQGMSLGFYCMITVGYLCGITAKLVSGNITYVLLVYVCNTLLVASNIPVYFRNRRVDRRDNPLSSQ